MVVKREWLINNVDGRVSSTMGDIFSEDHLYPLKSLNLTLLVIYFFYVKITIFVFVRLGYLHIPSHYDFTTL
jgi:hypothetical protein